MLEVGGGLGVLSEYLAQRAAHVHVVEIDERLRDALCDATDPHANVTVHWADAMALDLAALYPAPEQGRRQPALRRGRQRAAAQHRGAAERVCCGWRWCSARSASGWRRHRAAVRTARRRCSPSWRARWRCCGRSRAPCSIRCPTSTPCSCGMRRRDGRVAVVSPALRALVAGGFAHRRKTLAGLARPRRRGIGIPPAPLARAGARRADALGHPADARAERLSPDDFRALARLLEL